LRPVQPGIQVEDVRKRFGGAEVLRGIDLEVAPGETVALMGANGAGKSTLLRILAGTVTPDSGRALIHGFDTTREHLEASRVTGRALGDEHKWQLRLGGAANLQFFARLRGTRRVQAAADAAAALAALGLTDVADRPVGAYSTGMRARLALARARLAPFHALLLDEPSRALDARWRAELWDWLRRPQREDAVLMATHDPTEAAEVADRVALVAGGRVVEVLRRGLNAEQVAARLAEIAP
jgi:ABC-type multidrug transport system ATPase subunit